MFLDIRQNSTGNSTNSFVADYFTMCEAMYEGPVFWACFNSVCVLLGFPACVTVLWELFQKLRRGTPITPNDVFMLNLTVMDLVFLSFNPLSTLNYLFWHIWPLEVLFTFIFAFTATGRPLFMTCICLDCYLAVVHPITYRVRKGLTSRVLMSIVVWAVTLVYGGLYAFLYTDMMTNPASGLPYVFTILTIMICDFFILRALKSSDPGGRDLHPQKKKALQIIINSLVMTLITYLPVMLVTCFNTLMPITDEVLVCRVISIVYCTVSAGSAIMPVLHLSNLKKLDFINLWCCKAV